MKTCNKDGCGRKHSAKGLCLTHYKAMRRKLETRTCAIDGCDGTVFSRGLCNAHYEQFRRGLTPGERSLQCERVSVEPFLARLEWLCADHSNAHVAKLLGVKDGTIYRWRKGLQPTIKPDEADRLENITWVESEDNSEVVEFAKTPEGKAMIEQMRKAA